MWQSDPIPTAGADTARVEGEPNGTVRIVGDVSSLKWVSARWLGLALLAITDAITDHADAELDIEMARHAHVSARWLGEMGKEQRSN